MTNCLSLFGHFVGSALKGLIKNSSSAVFPKVRWKSKQVKILDKMVQIFIFQEFSARIKKKLILKCLAYQIYYHKYITWDLNLLQRRSVILRSLRLPATQIPLFCKAINMRLKIKHFMLFYLLWIRQCIFIIRYFL